jgi:hypothetical protein
VYFVTFEGLHLTGSGSHFRIIYENRYRDGYLRP